MTLDKKILKLLAEQVTPERVEKVTDTIYNGLDEFVDKVYEVRKGLREEPKDAQSVPGSQLPDEATKFSPGDRVAYLGSELITGTVVDAEEVGYAYSAPGDVTIIRDGDNEYDSLNPRRVVPLDHITKRWLNEPVSY